MHHHDLYDSLRLDRSLSCDQLALELDNRIAALGPQGGPRVPEMQVARAVLSDSPRRRMYDGQLADISAPPITPEDIMVLAEMGTPSADAPYPPASATQPTSSPAWNTAQQWGQSASAGFEALREKAGAWSREAARESTLKARAAAERYGAVDASTGRPDIGRRVGALFLDASCVILIGLVIAIPALIYMFNNLSGTVSAAMSGDFAALGELFRLWKFSGHASALLPFTALIIAVGLVAYCICSEVFWGGSLGKKVLGCRVITADGERPDLTAAAKRNWWPVLFFLPAVGLLLWTAVVIALAVTILTDRQGLSFLDKWAGVAVVPGPSTTCPKNTYDWSA